MDHKKDDKDKISKLDKIKLLISALSLLFSGTVMLKLFSVETNIQDVKATIVSSNVENTTNNYGAVL